MHEHVREWRGEAQNISGMSTCIRAMPHVWAQLGRPRHFSTGGGNPGPGSTPVEERIDSSCRGGLNDAGIGMLSPVIGAPQGGKHAREHGLPHRLDGRELRGRVREVSKKCPDPRQRVRGRRKGGEWPKAQAGYGGPWAGKEWMQDGDVPRGALMAVCQGERQVQSA